MKDHTNRMNFEPIERTDSEKKVYELISQLYMGENFTGDDTNRAFCMLMLTNKQGSVGIEEVMCEKLGLHQNRHKHGFDGKHKKTNELYELKPAAKFSPSATYNDVTMEKVYQLMNTPNNKVVYASHTEVGNLIFMAIVSGANIAQILKSKFDEKKEKIMSGKKIGSRQTHSVSLNSYITKFGISTINVVYYKPHKKFQKNIVKLLGLNSEVNNLDKIRETDTVVV